MKDEDFVMQSMLDKFTKQYLTENYNSPTEALISLSAGRKIKLREKLEDGNIRIYNIRSPFILTNKGDAFPQEFDKKDSLKFDRKLNRLSKNI